MTPHQGSANPDHHKGFITLGFSGDYLASHRSLSAAVMLLTQ